MSTFTDILDRLRGMEPEKVLGLRPPYPPVVLQFSPGSATLIRVKNRRRGRPTLEACQTREITEPCVPASIFQQTPAHSEELDTRLRELFERSGTRPGRVSLVLPDNLAKISLLTLPERPASRRHLEEIVRAKMRRAVPFRLDEASITYQLLPGDGKEAAVLVVLVRQSLVERFEHALDGVGARVGLIDIATPNLVNLYRATISTEAKNGGDVALLNCSENYFSLVIVREQRLIFFRCKTFALGETPTRGPNGSLIREIASSFSYYREKLAGQGVHRIFVRAVGTPMEQVVGNLTELGVQNVERLDPARAVEIGEGVQLDPETAQRIAPAVGAAAGRGR